MEYRAGRPSGAARRWDLTRFTGSESLDIRGAERFAPYCPISALELVDTDPGDRPHVLTLDLNHGFSDFCDQLLLLGRCEHVFDDIDRNEWHLMTSIGSVTRDR